MGNYRVFLNIDEVIEIAIIEEVKKRDAHTNVQIIEQGGIPAFAVLLIGDYERLI